MANTFNQEAVDADIRHISTQLENVMRRLDAGSTSFLEVKVALAGIESTMRNVTKELGALASRVTALEADFNQRRGERGVWAALVNSKLAAWLVAAGIAVWAAFPHVKEMP